MMPWLDAKELIFVSDCVFRMLGTSDDEANACARARVTKNALRIPFGLV